MPRINKMVGAIGVVQRRTKTVTGVGTSASVGFFNSPREGRIVRIKVSAVSNLTTFNFALAESDVFTGGTHDTTPLIGYWTVDEPRHNVKSTSTTYVLDEASGDLYFLLTDDASGKTGQVGKLYYMVMTDDASATTVSITIDIEATA